MVWLCDDDSAIENERCHDTASRYLASSLSHHCIIDIVPLRRRAVASCAIALSSLSHKRTIAPSSSYHSFIVIALSHYRRKCRWYDDAIVNYMALSGFHNNMLLKLPFLLIMIYWAKWAHVIYYVFSQCVLNWYMDTNIGIGFLKII